MELQGRDERILKVCYEHRFLLIDQVHRYFFPKASKGEAYRRIREMERVGWLRRNEFSMADGQRLIRLTRLGAEIASGLAPEEVPQPKHIDSITFEHDRILASARLRLEEFWDALWFPDATFKDPRRKINPDGVFEFPSGVRFAVEVENSLKEKRRFMGLLETWTREARIRDEEVALVLFIATTPALYKTLKRYLEASPAKERMRFALVLWEALEAGQPTLWSPDGSAAHFLSIRAFEFAKKEAQQ